VRGDPGIPLAMANAGTALGALGAALARAQAAGAEAGGEKIIFSRPGGGIQGAIRGPAQPFHLKSLPRKTRRVFSSRTTWAGVPLLRMRPLWMM